MEVVLTVIAYISAIVVVIGLIGYMATTNKIIKSQEREIAELKSTVDYYEKITPLESRAKPTDVKFGGF